MADAARWWRRVAGLAAALAVGGCGTGDGPASDDSEPEASVPVTSSPNEPCALYLGLISATDVVRVDVRAGETVVVERQGELSVLEANSDWVVLASRPSESLGADVDTDIGYRTVYSWGVAGFTDAPSLEAVLDSEAPVLFTHVTPLEPGRYEQALQGVGNLRPDGSIELLGPCADRWQRPLEVVAARHGRATDAQFLIEALYWGSELYNEVVREERGEPVALTWNDYPADIRSLELRDIPKSERSRFKLVGCDVDLAKSGAAWVRIATAEGIVGTYSASSVTGIVPMMIPRGDGPVTISVLGENDVPRAGTRVDPTLFDEYFGCRITASTNADGQAVFDVSVLAEGELERLMGMTRDEIEDLRARALDL